MSSYDVEWYHHLPKHVKEILADLEKAGYASYVVGGAVRDLWLGCEPKDYDLVSDATPEQIEKIFAKTLDVGRAFGIMIVVTPEGQVEIARFRSDGAYTDGRHPNGITFSSPEEDARRRDFTINALFYDPKAGQVIDYVDGVKDLENRLIRTVGEPAERFQEDALRMLRAVRFHSQLAHLGFNLQESLHLAIHAFAPRLKLVSRERVTQELTRIFSTKRPAIGLEDLVKTGLWEYVFGSPAPESTVISRFDRLSPVFEAAFGRAPLPGLFFSAATIWVAHQFPEKFFVLGRESKASLICVPERIAEILNFPHLSLARKKRLVTSAGFEEAWAILNAGDSDLPLEIRDIPLWRKAQESAGTLNPAPLLKGADLMAKGIPSGPGMKVILEKIRDQQLEGALFTKEQALALAVKLHEDK